MSALIADKWRIKDLQKGGWGRVFHPSWELNLKFTYHFKDLVEKEGCMPH
jgi:hypothetical protein